MADYYTETVIQPNIPAHLITAEDRTFFEAFDITIEPRGEDKVFLYADNGCTASFLPGPDGTRLTLTEADLYAKLQDLICRSKGEFLWVSIETSYYCSDMRPDGFGGSAVFITEDDVQCTSTSGWLEQRINEAETGNFGPETEDMPGLDTHL